MEYIEQWFSGTGSGEEIVFHFDTIQATGEYVFDALERSTPLLRYTISERVREKVGDDLINAVNVLGFDQNDNSSEENDGRANDIKIFMRKHHLYCLTFEIMQQLVKLGHPDVTFAPAKLSSQSVAGAKAFNETFSQRLTDWRLRINELRIRNRLLLLFTTSESLTMYKFMSDLSNHSVELDSMIHSRLGRCRIDAEDIRTAKSSSEEVFWPDIVTRVLAMKAPETLPIMIMPKTPLSSTKIHVLDCNCRENVLRLLLYLYGERRPEGFEVFFCSPTTKDDDIQVFLERASVFPERIYTLIEADELPLAAQELVLRFLLKQKDCSLSFHILQSSPTILHATQFVSQKVWNFSDNSSIRDLPTVELMERIYKQIRQIEITTITSDKCSSGKTRHAKKMMCEWPEEQRFIFSINEHFDLHDVIDRLFAIVKKGKQSAVLLFQVHLAPQQQKIWDALMRSLTDFFYALIVMNSVNDNTTASIFHLPDDHEWTIFVELPSSSDNDSSKAVLRDIPVLHFCGEIVNPPDEFDITDEARVVCKYLHAHKEGEIDKQFSGAAAVGTRQIVAVLDDSGSMSGNRTLAAVESLKDLVANLGDEDEISLFRFDNSLELPPKIDRSIIANLGRPRINDIIDTCLQPREGGTNLWGALQQILNNFVNAQGETWIVCLTDGESADSHAAFVADFCNPISQKPNTHLILIGVGLQASRVAFYTSVCTKFGSDPLGEYLPCGTNPESIAKAFCEVKRRVSEHVEAEGEHLEGDDGKCRDLLEEYWVKYLPEGGKDNMLLRTFFVEYLWRRIDVFRKNSDFNENDQYEGLGTMLMNVMFEEIRRSLSSSDGALDGNFQQLIYDYSIPDNPQFRLFSAKPELLKGKQREHFEKFDPLLVLPLAEKSRDRLVLDEYLSQAITGLERDESSRKISEIDDEGFVLTIDFVAKMLNMYERLQCGLPCIIEGETGVSKTALTRMFSILLNSSVKRKAKQVIEEKLSSVDVTDPDALHELVNTLPSYFERPSEDFIDAVATDGAEGNDDCEDTLSLLDESESCEDLVAFLKCAKTIDTFYEMNIHSSLSSAEVVESFTKWNEVALSVDDDGLSVVVFLDEVNTASCLGLFKEISIDHTLMGEQLSRNLIVIAACNPARRDINSGHDDLGRDWALGHYQVHKLFDSMEHIKWQYGSLNKSQEEEFIQARLEMIDAKQGGGLLGKEEMGFADFVSECQENIRDFAEEHIVKRAQSRGGTAAVSVVDDDSRLRARSAVSLRDIQRVFNLIEFFSEFPLVKDKEEQSKSDGSVLEGRDAQEQKTRRVLLLTVATCYYLRLDSEYRMKFLEHMSTKYRSSDPDQLQLETVLGEALEEVVKNTNVDETIAITQGLKENIFCTLVCSLSRIPLVIVGPPGSR